MHICDENAPKIFKPCPIGLVKQRASLVDEELSEKEREFLWLVRIGDLDSIKAFFQNDFRSINADCCDYRGQRALDIAVSNRDAELVMFLLDHLPITTLHYYCAILRAVFVNDIMLLELLLDRAEENNQLHGRLHELISGSSECTECLPEVAVTNMTPTMAAAANGNVEITRMLLEKGYCIQKPHRPKCRCRESCIRRTLGGETLTESISRMNAYRALSSPTYLILTSEDPILSAFELSRELDHLSKELAENQKEYKELSSKCSKFAADILNECRNTEEVQTVLVQKKGFSDPRPHRFSRLHLAVQYRQKEFVTHPSCQQVLRSMWVESLGSWYSWPLRARAFHIIKHAFLTPIVSLAFIFIPRAEIIGPLRVPLNRFIYSATSYLFFLLLLIVTLLNDRRYDLQSPATWTEMAVCCFVIAHSWDILTNLISIGFSSYFRSWWSVFDLILFSLFLLSELLWCSVYIVNKVTDYKNHSLNRMGWAWYHPILIGEGIYAAASVMAFTRVLLWFQLNSKLGPLGTSLKYMVVDVARFFMLFFIIMFAFATGINSIYKNYKDSSRIEDDEVVRQPDSFVTLRSTFKNLFWAIFGMAEPDFAQIVLGQNNTNKSLEENAYHSEHLFTEGVGYTLWGFYHMVTVVIMLNMLIAMMTESYQRVQTNADREWKFACSTLWLSIFDNHSVVPPPFNLIPSMYRITLLFKWLVSLFRGNLENSPGKLSWSPKRCCYWDSEEDHCTRKAEEEKYEKLIVQLIRRYLHCNIHQPTTSICSSFIGDSKEKFKEEIFNELCRTLKIPTRRYTKIRRNLQTTDNVISEDSISSNQI